MSMQQFWVFGYGSLMWKPGFDFVESQPALIRGLHRALCVVSHVHRGTPERPGLVLGLDRGGSCHGIAYRVEEHKWQDTIAYLRAREQVTMVYLEQTRQVGLLKDKRSIDAITYIVDRNHLQYAGQMDDQRRLELIRQGQGVSGACIDYVFNTLSHLREMNIHDAALERLAQQLKG